MTMELKLNAGDKIQIPDNCNAIVKNGVVVIEENKPKFKKGDFVIGKDCYLPREVKIVKFVSDGKCHYDSNNACSFEYLRYATNSEKQLLLDKLHENGKDWDAEKCEIVDLEYVPKVGDCLKLEYGNNVRFIQCSGLEDGKYPCGYSTIIDRDGVSSDNVESTGWGSAWKVIKITREELQDEFNKLGYEYDFNTHTAKKIEWKPKYGDKYYTIVATSVESGVVESSYSDCKYHKNRIANGLYFRTRELAESALELLKNAKRY